MQMPEIKTCDINDCAYNSSHQCHALAIMVGGEQGPLCDTFWHKGEPTEKAGDLEQIGHIGACHMKECRFNDSLECAAEQGIQIGQQEQKASCMTFSHK